MSAKTSRRRREAFFAALTETGNQTIAAERAKVSRSWVSLHRAEEPEFRARMEACIAEARLRLAGQPGNQPPEDWSDIAGEELVIRGSNGRRLQIARARVKQWTVRAETRFLHILRNTCNVKLACRAAGLSVASAYNHRDRWAWFAKAWREAEQDGFYKVEFELIEHSIRKMDALRDGYIDMPEPDMVLPEMTIAEVIQVVQLHNHTVRNIGKRPGRWRAKYPDADAARKTILKNVEAVRRYWEATEAERNQETA